MAAILPLHLELSAATVDSNTAARRTCDRTSQGSYGQPMQIKLMTMDIAWPMLEEERDLHTRARGTRPARA